MKLLLDSHVYLWMLYGQRQFKKSVQAEINSADEVLISLASLWELSLKANNGRLPHPAAELVAGAKALKLKVHPIRPAHILRLSEINLLHKDPFDHLMVAQCEVDGLTLVTADRQLLNSQYGTLDARPTN